MKRGSPLLISLQGNKNKTTVKYQYISLKRIKWRQKIPSVCENVEQLEVS